MTRAGLFLLLLVSACASGQAAPISYGGGGARAQEPARTTAPPTETAQRSGRGAAIEYRGAAPVPQTVPPQQQQAIEVDDPAPMRAPTVQEAPDIFEGEGTPLSEYALQPDEVQPYDPARLPRTHRVGADESLYDIATRYQVPLRALIDQNELQPPYALTPGRELQLPPPRFHTVARGESFEAVAQRYNVDTRSLALLNRMQAPYRVNAGDRIVLPAMARAAPPPAPAPVIAEVPRTAANARFAMPMRGPIVGRFGPMQGGGRREGVEIGGREGDAVMASADGEVFYAGDDLPAYGTLVLIRHADNYVTAYGFNRRALVREGQSVRAGQQIAELGPRADGRARLLFQVRLSNAVVDPAPLLGVGD